MNWEHGQAQRFEVGGAQLEGRWLGPGPGEAPTLALLHGGLGSMASWGDLPEALARETGWGVFSWSRAGFGQSEARGGPRTLACLEREALALLPEVLGRIGFQQGVLHGHGEGAALASLYVGSVMDHRVRGLILEAPRFFLEPQGVEEVRRLAQAHSPSFMAELARHHRHPREVLEGWFQTWIEPAGGAWNIEDVVDYFRIPALALQGAEDPYGGRAQLQVLEERTYSPLEVHLLEGCGHAPHQEQPGPTRARIVEFLGRLSRIEAAEVERR